MTNSKTTKRALVASILSLLLCVSMLIGSTFAWFTDTATTGVNTIQTGTLDIELMMKDGDSWTNAKDKALGFVDENGNAILNILWEPGCRYLLQPIKVVNNGNLNAKCKIVVSAVNINTNGDADLASVIDVYEDNTKLGTLRTFLDMASSATGIKEFILAPNGGEAAFGELKLVMQETAGNEYQGASLESIAITVFATQTTVEKDSSDNQYDANATYDKADEYKAAGYKVVNVNSQEELHMALNNATTTEPIAIMLSGDTDTYNFPTWTTYSGSFKNKTIAFIANSDKTFDATFFNVNGSGNLVGANLTIDGVNVNFPANSYMSNGYTGMNLADGKLVIKNATISGAQYLYVPTAEFINCVFENGADSYSICTYGAQNVTFTGCTFNTAGKAVLMYCDGAVTTNATLTNCTFNSDDSVADGKAAVETGDDGSKLSEFNIDFTNCTSNGFDANNSTSPLWGNKANSNMPTDRLNVIIDGVDVY